MGKIWTILEWRWHYKNFQEEVKDVAFEEDKFDNKDDGEYGLNDNFLTQEEQDVNWLWQFRDGNENRIQPLNRKDVI